jgi:DNA-binding transcriptional ArsR family regulator
MTPGALAEHFDISRQAVSKHIKVLTESKVLIQEKQGREIYYHFNRDTMAEIDTWLQKIKQNWEDRFNQLDTVLNNLKTNKDEN